MVTLEQIRAARERLHGVALRTALIPCPHQDSSRQLFFKPENLQPIGAFKLRGAYNKIATLTDAERRRGVITYSSGNHAQGVAYAARALGTRAVVVMPRTAPPRKIESTRSLGAEVVLVGPSSLERFEKAEALAAEHGYVVVPPYDDPEIIAGQGTIGLEILEDLPEVETVLVPIGGGGLISGISTALKQSRPGIRVIGVEPALAADAQASFREGRIVKLPAEQVSQTMADGLRAMWVGDLTFEHMRQYVDDVVTVSEQEILDAMRLMALNTRLVAEPSGVVTFAAFLFRAQELPSTRLNVAVISGGNVDPALLAKALMADHSG
ncbi:MAG: threonine/serine dehydratase [Candidatus Korobacteraceae bacterium]